MMLGGGTTARRPIGRTTFHVAVVLSICFAIVAGAVGYWSVVEAPGLVSSPNDVVDELTGLKVCGCALRLTERAVLVQASLPNGKPLVPPETVIRNAALTYREWDSRGFAPALERALREIG